MPFNSLGFVYGFLPIGVTLMHFVHRTMPTRANIVLILLSMVFMALDSTNALLLLLSSAAINYAVGSLIVNIQQKDGATNSVLAYGIGMNVLFLAFFKYANGAFAILNHVLGTHITSIALPLAISFYTFSQISYLIELSRKQIEPPSAVDYLCYVLFFPKLIAGPIARPSEFLPQLKMVRSGAWLSEQRWKGAAFFIVGLFKKACIADSLSPYTDRVFDLANAGGAIGFYQAWCGVFSYGLQLYFDFSGYTDMAIGAALMVGIILPPNFDAPYRATSISDFWRRWHMSLSFFFRDYLYIFLGGNRKGELRRYANVLIVMVLCGMWHGSGIQFAAWGALHGFFITIHALWSRIKKTAGWQFVRYEKQRLILARLLTLFCVMIAWVPFRAASMQATWRLFGIMADFPTRLMTSGEFYLMMITVVPALLIVWVFPTSQNWLKHEGIGKEENILATENGMTIDTPQTPPLPWTAWRLNIFWGLCLGCMAATSLISIAGGARFIYGGF